MEETTNSMLSLIQEYRETLERVQLAVDKLTSETLSIVLLAADILKDARRSSDENELSRRHLAHIVSEQRKIEDREG